MNARASRTCTEWDDIHSPTQPAGAAGGSMPLSEVRSVSAYVLLGDPGAGKTTAFETECGECAEALKVEARDLITFDVERNPQWRGKTLFIDGLDEVRSGTSDSTTPFDKVRHQLEQLDRPRFRISCRTADWLGDSDRKALEGVSCDSQVAVLTLDPLDDLAIRSILTAHMPGLDVETFRDEARRRGVGAMLDNPQTLLMLADAVAPKEVWPHTRLDLFEAACRQMGTERNEQHRIADLPSTRKVLDAAGRLCALTLLSDQAGYLAHNVAPSANSAEAGFVSLVDLQDTGGGVSDKDARAAVSSALFTAQREGRFVPRHRQVAEFLAGRYLASLIAQGLPARRVLALMVSPADGRVATSLRGLSGWLAAHSGEARGWLIDADPVGVGLYGDLTTFSTSDKTRLLESLAAHSPDIPLWTSRWDERSGRYRNDTGWAFRALVSSDMAPEIRALLEDQTAATTREPVIRLLLGAISETAPSMPADLIGCVEATMRDESRPQEIRHAAIGAYAAIVASGRCRPDALKELLDAISSGAAADPHDELRGDLLEALYPDTVAPAQVWQYLRGRNDPDLLGLLWGFCHHALQANSSDEQVAQMLDALAENADDLVPALEEAGWAAVPPVVLARGLEACGDTLEPARRYGWLSAAGSVMERPTSWPRDPTGRVRCWLEARPDIQREIFVEWVRRRCRGVASRGREHGHPYPLFGSTLPGDHGLWCLEQAVALADSEPDVSLELLRRANHARGDPALNTGLTIDILEQHGRSHPALAHELAELRKRSIAATTERSHWQQKLQAIDQRNLEEQQQIREGWGNHLRDHEAALRNNTFAVQDLNILAKVYLGEIPDLDEHASPEDRLADFIGGDYALVDATKAGLCASLTRDDVPDVDETISLLYQSRLPWMAFPMLAGLRILDDEDRASVDELDDGLKRRALALHYCVRRGDRRPLWYDRWLQQDTDMVFDVLERCLVVGVRKGDDLPAGLSDLEGISGHEDRKHAVKLKMLRSYPTRAPERQIRLLDRLLGEVLNSRDKAAIRGLAQSKLSAKSMTVAQKIRWATVDALLRPGGGLGDLKACVAARETRSRHFAAFLYTITKRLDTGELLLPGGAEPETVRDIIEVLGDRFEPRSIRNRVTLETQTSDLIARSIATLATQPNHTAHQALDDLAANPDLEAWKTQIIAAAEHQSVIYRDASYAPPGIEDVQRALAGRAPANAADLKAVLTERIERFAAELRGSNTNPWRRFWNEDQHGQPANPKPEESCRDALISELQPALRLSGVELQPERRYAAGKRADITAHCNGFNVPIEIKKHSHTDLWTAMRSQLINQYTTDPQTAGHGIYLVLWFGKAHVKPAPAGDKPNTPHDLQRLLEEDLTPDEARKLCVAVLDVTKPAA